MTLNVFAADSAALLQRCLLTFNRQEHGPHMLCQTTSTDRNLIPRWDNDSDHPDSLHALRSEGGRERAPVVPVDRVKIKNVITVYVVTSG